MRVYAGGALGGMGVSRCEVDGEGEVAMSG